MQAPSLYRIGGAGAFRRFESGLRPKAQSRIMGLHSADRGDINEVGNHLTAWDAMRKKFVFTTTATRLLLGCLLWILFFTAACGTAEPHSAEAPPTPVEIVTGADLLEALDRAGVEVAETEMVLNPIDETQGRAYQVGSALVMLYESEDAQAQRRISERLVSGDTSGAKWFSLFEKPPYVWASGNLILIYPGEEGGLILTISALMGDPILGVESVADEPFPPGVVTSIAWLAQTLQVAPGAIEVLEFESATWPDSCLGLAELDEECALVTVPGWRIVARVDQAMYALRTDEMGLEVRLETETVPQG